MLHAIIFEQRQFIVKGDNTLALSRVQFDSFGAQVHFEIMKGFVYCQHRIWSQDRLIYELFLNWAFS